MLPNLLINPLQRKRELNFFRLTIAIELLMRFQQARYDIHPVNGANAIDKRLSKPGICHRGDCA